MYVRLIAQPFRDQTNLLEIVPTILVGMNQLAMVVAWVKRSGLRRLQAAIEEFRRESGRARLIVGIDEGGATRQGLELALDVFDEVYVFHDIEGRTFHPKVYLTHNEAKAFLAVGSNNLTAGGLHFNYEVAMLLELQRGQQEDDNLWTWAETYISRLLGDSGACLRLTRSRLDEMVREKRYRIQDEDLPRRRPPASAEDSDTSLDLGADSLFRRSQQAKRPVALSREPRRRPVAAPPTASVFLPADVIRRWIKKLTYSDAQQPQRPRSNPTGNMRLTQAGHPIDQTTYFRQVFFSDANWRVRSGSLEETTVTFDVSIDGKAFASRQLKVDHDPVRVAGQNNAPTFLHWGEELSRELRARNYAGLPWRVCRMIGDEPPVSTCEPP